MTVSHDAYSEMAAENRGPGMPAAFSWTHTPSGTPKGILLWVVSGPTASVSGDNAITGCTYGGVAMTKVREVHGTGSEPGSAWLYELLSSIPTGPQTVEFTTNAFPLTTSGGYPWWFGMAVSMASGGGALVRADDDQILNGNLANPSVTMDAGANTGISYLGGYSARGAEANITAATGCTYTGGYEWTNSDDTACVLRQTTPSTSTFAIGFTATADDVAMAAATYYEAASADMLDPLGMSGFFGA